MGSVFFDTDPHALRVEDGGVRAFVLGATDPHALRAEDDGVGAFALVGADPHALRAEGGSARGTPEFK